MRHGIQNPAGGKNRARESNDGETGRTSRYKRPGWRHAYRGPTSTRPARRDWNRRSSRHDVAGVGRTTSRRAPSSSMIKFERRDIRNAWLAKKSECQCISESYVAVHRTVAVNSHRESWLWDRHSRRAPASGGKQPTAENGGVPGLFRPDHRRRECRPKASWQRERNCRQTLSGPKSMTYEPHELWWMLPRES